MPVISAFLIIALFLGRKSHFVPSRRAWIAGQSDIGCRSASEGSRVSQQFRSPVMIAPKHQWQSQGLRVARDKTSRVGRTTEKPAQNPLVRPIRNLDLISCQKANSRADAVNRRPAGAVRF